MQPRVVVPDHLQVALEQRMIGDVEAGQGGVEPDVGLGDVVAEQVRGLARGEVGLEAVEAGEEGVHVGVVGGLGGGEAALVDAVVDGVVDPGVHGVDVGAVRFGEEGSCGFAQPRGDEGVEGGVEHADDLGGLVVDDGFALAVPEGRDGVAARVVRVGFVVELGVLGEAVEGVVRRGAGGGVVEPGKRSG